MEEGYESVYKFDEEGNEISHETRKKEKLTE